MARDCDKVETHSEHGNKGFLLEGQKKRDIVDNESSGGEKLKKKDGGYEKSNSEKEEKARRYNEIGDTKSSKDKKNGSVPSSEEIGSVATVKFGETSSFPSVLDFIDDGNIAMEKRAAKSSSSSCNSRDNARLNDGTIEISAGHDSSNVLSSKSRDVSEEAKSKSKCSSSNISNSMISKRKASDDDAKPTNIIEQNSSSGKVESPISSEVNGEPNKRFKVNYTSECTETNDTRRAGTETENVCSNEESDGLKQNAIPSNTTDSGEEENPTINDDSNSSSSPPPPPEELISRGSSPAHASESNDLSDPQICYNSDSDDDMPQDQIKETRAFLKKHGSVRFLEQFLPPTATSRDIVQLIAKLGFCSPQILREIDDNANVMNYVKILHQAMLKVLAIRDKLPNVTTFEDALRLIEECNNVLVVTGAGISTSLGIPDFRSSKGFYSMVQHLGLSDPQEVFDLDTFLSDPSLFYSIAYMVLPPEETYSPLHSFIQLLQSKGKLLRNYTQNIDNLESYAGILPENVVQCHGSFATATCVTCGDQVAGEEIFGRIRDKEIPYCARCTLKKNSILQKDDDYYFAESYGVYKPDITFFGESLPSRFHNLINEDIAKCDLLICIGTSLKVAPVADIIDKIPKDVPQILINKDPINHCQFDVSLLGYCDDVASLISHNLGNGWKLPHKEYDRIRGGVNGDNLSISLIDPELREYSITNRDQEQVQKEKEIAIEHDSG